MATRPIKTSGVLVAADIDTALERQVAYVSKRHGTRAYIITTWLMTSGDESK